MKIFLWIIFSVIVVALSVQLKALEPSDYKIRDLELAYPQHGQEILKQWQVSYSGNLSFLEIARSNTQWDFLFIAVYTTLLITMSNWQMQREKWFPLNEALRFNFLLAALAAILDIFENFGMLHNFHHADDAPGYWNTHWLALFKFILLGLALLIFVISFIKSLIGKKRVTNLA